VRSGRKSDDDGADHPEADATHDQLGQPSRDEADHQNDDEASPDMTNHHTFSEKRTDA